MASKSKILIIGGTGCLGKFMVEASVKLAHQTFVLLREPAFSNTHICDHFKSLGVNMILGDIYDEESLVHAIKQVDVVISAVGHRCDHSYTIMQDQINLIKAIKKAGNIKRFLPSEFGMDVDKVDAIGPAKRLVKVKSKVRRVIKEQGIPFTFVCASYFARTTLTNFFQPHLQTPPSDRVFILGNGTPQAIFNMEEDICMYSIKAVDDPRTLNKILYIRPPANFYSFNELVSLWEKKINKTIERIYVPEELLVKNIEEEQDALMKLLLSVSHSAFVKGNQTNFEIQPSLGVEASALYPEVKYTTVDEFLDRFV